MDHCWHLRSHDARTYFHIGRALVAKGSFNGA